MIGVFFINNSFTKSRNKNFRKKGKWEFLIEKLILKNVRLNPTFLGHLVYHLFSIIRIFAIPHFSRVTRALSFTVSRSSSLASLYPRCFFHGQHLRGENVATKILILCTLFSIYVRIIASLVIFNVWITRNIYNIGIIIRWKDYVRNSENVIDRCTRKTDRQARKRIDRFARARTIDRDHSLHFHHALLFVSRKIKNDAIFHKHIFRILM